MSYEYDGKRRTSKECKKTDCIHYQNRCIPSGCPSGGHMQYCMNCRWAHVSQYKKEAQK